jgi:hypothetical protein
MIFDDFKKGLDIVFHPNRETHVNLSLKGALLMYYKFAVVPIILTMVAALVISVSLPGILASVPSSQLVGGSVAMTIEAYNQFLFSLVVTPLLIPLVLFVIAGMLHVVGRVLRMFEGSFTNTFTAVVYAEFSSLLFWCVISFGAFGSIIYFIALIYGIYVLVVGLSKQHKTSATNAFIVGLVVFIFLVIVASIFVSSYAAALQSSGALSGS